MLVEVINAFYGANGRIYHVGDVVDLPDGYVAELLFIRRVRIAPPAPKRNNRRRKQTTDVSDDAAD
jgi:hypothetical protein